VILGEQLFMSNDIHRGRLFVGCIIALVATAFGFIVRALILDDWRQQFNLSQEQIGFISGAGLFPFAISIILFSLIVDKIGYGVSMGFAFLGHLLSAVVTILAGSASDPDTAFQMLYFGSFVCALANGIVEAVINPVTATMYDQNKTHYLNILHAGWPLGLVLGGLLTIGFVLVPAGSLPQFTFGLGSWNVQLNTEWQWKVALLLIPTLLYGLLLAGQRFPVQERVAAGVSFRDMLREFGAGSCFIVAFLLVCGLFQVLKVTGFETIDWFGQQISDELEPLAIASIVAAAAALLFLIVYHSFGRPMFVFLLLIMLLLATTELGTDGWISDIMKDVLKQENSTFNYGALVLIYTSFIMFVLRFFAGPIVHRISPLGLLAVSAAVACIGLLLLSSVGTIPVLVFIAATIYGFGKTFFWPTTLGVVSEQFPRGGALMLNAIAGVGMIGVGVLGAPLIGTVQDQTIDAGLLSKAPEVRSEIVKPEKGLLGEVMVVDQNELRALPEKQRDTAEEVIAEERQGTLAKIAVLPGIMFLCYLLLIGYFRLKGGYKTQAISHEEESPSEY
jgi:MFS family permease